MVLEVVLDFPAGYALYDSSSKNVTPRPGTGHIVVSKDSDDPYYYFTWEPRDGFTPTEEISAREPLLLIPGDASWVHINKCTSGRVFALKFESSDKREFFWMQTKNDSKDKNLGALSKADKEVMETFQKCLTEDEQDDEEDDEDEDMADVNTHSTKEEPSNA